MRRGRQRASAGFSVVELLMATAVLLMALATVFQAVAPAQSALLVEPERAEMSQRARFAAAILADDLRRAGAGTSFGTMSGTLDRVLPPIAPFRRGRRLADAPGAFRDGVVSIVHVPHRGPHATLASPLPARSGSAAISLEPGCRVADPSCGFAAGMSVLVFDTAHHSLFSIASVAGSTLSLVHDSVDSTHVFAAARSHVIQVDLRTYFLRPDPSGEAPQLARYGGASGADVPVVDHLVSLEFVFLGESEPPALIGPRDVDPDPWTTYGPAPPPLGVQDSLYGPGESCLFTTDGLGHAPRLPVLGSGLVRLTAADVADGPWCPDAADPNRFDADLLRIRAISVRVRVEAAADAFRGPAGLLFARAGSGAAPQWLPDLALELSVTLRGSSGSP